MKTKQYTHIIQTKTGKTIRIRPLRPDDADLLVDIFDHMSPWSRYQRFHQTVAHVSELQAHDVAEGILRDAGRHKWGLIAFADCVDGQDVAVGVARYVALEDGESDVEVAISIRDDFHDMGIGSQMMALTVEHAREAGFPRAVASIQNDNPAIWKVFERLPYVVTRRPAGTLSDIVIDLGRCKDLSIRPSAGRGAA